MTISEITAQVEREHQCVLFRKRKEALVKGAPVQYDVKDYGLEHRGNKRGWAFMDATTAHAMNVCRAALKPENREKWDRLPLPLLIKFTWEAVE